MNEYASEEIYIDPAVMDGAFSRGLQSAGANYLEALKNMAINDYELEGVEDAVITCFDTLQKFVSTKGKNVVDQIKLNDLVRFGLTPDVVSRIGYLAFQYESVSPVTRNRQFSGDSPVKGGVDNKHSFGDEQYDDDFEVEDDAEMAHFRSQDQFLDNSDELYVSPSKHSQQHAGDRGAKYAASNRYDSKRSGGRLSDTQRSSDLEDIEDEDETYDTRRASLNRNHMKVSPEPVMPHNNAHCQPHTNVPSNSSSNNRDRDYYDRDRDNSRERREYSTNANAGNTRQSNANLKPRESPEISYIPNSRNINKDFSPIGSNSKVQPEPYQPVLVHASHSGGNGPDSGGNNSSSSNQGSLPLPTTSSSTTTALGAGTNNSNNSAVYGRNTSSRQSTASARSSRSRGGRGRTAGWIENKQWSLGGKIGSGAFGEVFRGLNDKVR
jgi:hypothetical protein